MGGERSFGQSQRVSFAAPANRPYVATSIGGAFQVPSRIEIGASLGKYRCSMTLNFALGAGSQFASLSLPGDSAWRASLSRSHSQDDLGD